MIAISNCGGITAPFLFPSHDSPMYSTGNWSIFAFLITAMCITCYTWYTFGSHAGYVANAEQDRDRQLDAELKLGEPLEDIVTVPVTCDGKPANSGRTPVRIDV